MLHFSPVHMSETACYAEKFKEIQVNGLCDWKRWANAGDMRTTSMITGSVVIVDDVRIIPLVLKGLPPPRPLTRSPCLRRDGL